VRPAHCLFLSIILKRNVTPYSLVEVPPWPPTQFQCKEDLSVSRAVLVLEYRRCGPVQSGITVSPYPPLR